MARGPSPDDLRLWSHVAATVRPLPGRSVARPVGEALPPRAPSRPPALSAPAAIRTTPPQEIEPRRLRRLARERTDLEAVLDLHGHDQDQAHRALRAFLFRAHDQGFRAVLVITGRGVRGGGVLRQRAPDWLAAADLRSIVAGYSPAHQKHGGEGALYVALKRKPA